MLLKLVEKLAREMDHMEPTLQGTYLCMGLFPWTRTSVFISLILVTMSF